MDTFFLPTAKKQTMVAAPRTKVADKQELCKKLLAALKKRYPHCAAPASHPVLETLLYAICLENANTAHANTAYQRVVASFHDLNEIRVSSVDEIRPLMTELDDPELRASRLKMVLQYVFEQHYSFEMESLKRKTLELATKQLQKIKVLTPFVRNYALQTALGAHLLPFDDNMHLVLEFIGLQAENGNHEQTGEALRSFVRKAEGPEFCNLLREFASEKTVRDQCAIIRQAPPSETATLPPPMQRLEALLKGEKVKWDLGSKKAIAEAAAAKDAKKDKGKAEAPKPVTKSPVKEAVKVAPAKAPLKPAAKAPLAKAPAKAPPPPAKKVKPAANTDKPVKKVTKPVAVVKKSLPKAPAKPAPKKGSGKGK